jgi:hypothetical protein
MTWKGGGDDVEGYGDEQYHFVIPGLNGDLSGFVLDSGGPRFRGDDEERRG